MDYTDLKRGDVIVMGINPKYSDDNDERIVIIDRVESNVVYKYMLYTYVELDISTIGNNDLFLEKEEPGYSYNENEESLDSYMFRLATDEEKNKLYNAIGKHFTEEYDKDWYKHFTDSSYFDIQDYLLEIFCIRIDEYDNDLLIPEFVGEIQNHIWDGCCKALGVSNLETEKPKEKMVSLVEAVKWLEGNFPELDYVGNWYKESFIYRFKKAMER